MQGSSVLASADKLLGSRSMPIHMGTAVDSTRVPPGSGVLWSCAVMCETVVELVGGRAQHSSYTTAELADDLVCQQAAHKVGRAPHPVARAFRLRPRFAGFLLAEVEPLHVRGQ